MKKKKGDPYHRREKPAIEKTGNLYRKGGR